MMNEDASSLAETEIATRLERERPVPGVEFRGSLGRYLEQRVRWQLSPAAMRRLLPICAILGVLLLLAAALGATGSGPLG